jgi:hypothetical protein
MAVVVIGHRRYGRVHAHGGEYAETVFAHLSFIPIFPMGSYWVTNEAGLAERVGFAIKLNGRSVLAAYLRTWMVAISLATFLAPSLVATAVAKSPRDKLWIAQLHGNIELDARSYGVFLDGEGEDARRTQLMVVVLAGLGAVVGWPLWIRAFLRRRRAA